MSQTRKLLTIDEMLRMFEEMLQSYPEDNDSYFYERYHLSKWIAFVQSKSTAVSLLQDQYTFKLILEAIRNLKHNRSSYPFLHLEVSDSIFVDRLTKLFFNNHITSKYQLEAGDSNCSKEIMILGHFAFQILKNGSEQVLLAHTIEWASARFGVPAIFIIQSINNLNLLIPGDDRAQSSFLIPQMKLIFASNYFSWFYIMLGDIPDCFKTSRVYCHQDMDESERQQVTKFLSENRKNPHFEELYTRILYSLSDPMHGPELVPGADEFRKVLLNPIKH